MGSAAALQVMNPDNVSRASLEVMLPLQIAGRMGRHHNRRKGKSVVDIERLRRDRLGKVQREMSARDIGALVLTDIVNIRYCTGVSVMPLWTAVNIGRYVVVPVSGDPVIFEYGGAEFRARAFWSDVRPSMFWQARVTDADSPGKAATWARQIKGVLGERGLADARIGIDVLDYNGFAALQAEGIRLTDADRTMSAARMIKLPAEIELMRQSCAIAEAALRDMEEAIRPGISENELLAIFWHRMLALGGEHCFTRLIVSGQKTNPWFHEAGDRKVASGELVAIDTDMVGPECYIADFSRTFLCGENASAAQMEAYRVAHDFVQGCASLIKPGVAFSDFVARCPPLPATYREQAYGVILHGIGVDDESPNIPLPGDPYTEMPDGEFQENMVLAVECYAGKVGAKEGVKLEDEVWVSAEGPVILSSYPYDAKLLG
jgi:Xaa-Pro aminopeptidase